MDNLTIKEYEELLRRRIDLLQVSSQKLAGALRSFQRDHDVGSLMKAVGEVASAFESEAGVYWQSQTALPRA